MTLFNYTPFFITPYYEYWGNIEKKRLYAKFIGSWQHPEIADAFLEDSQKILGLRPFVIENVISDVSMVGIAHHEKCKEAHKESHKNALQYIKKLVLILSYAPNHGDLFYAIPLHEQTGLPISASFYKIKTAEAYLDSCLLQMQEMNEF